jgi:hypothetical protein
MKKILNISLITVFAVVFLLIKSPSVNAITAEELQIQINDLLAQITGLQTELTKTIAKEDPNGNIGEFWCHDFKFQLGIGRSGPEVEALQIALGKQHFNVPSHTELNTDYFGEYTFYTVKVFQEQYASEILAPYGLTEGTGFVGTSTKAKLNSLYGCKPTFFSTGTDELEYFDDDDELNKSVWDYEWTCFNDNLTWLGQLKRAESWFPTEEFLLREYGQTLEEYAGCGLYNGIYYPGDYTHDGVKDPVDYLMMGAVITYHDCMDMDNDNDVDVNDQYLWHAKYMCSPNMTTYNCTDWRNLLERIKDKKDTGGIPEELFSEGLLFNVPSYCELPADLMDLVEPVIEESLNCNNNYSYDLDTFLESDCNQCEFTKVTPSLWGWSKWYYGPPPILSQLLACVGITSPSLPDMLKCPKGFKVTHPGLVLDVEGVCQGKPVYFSITIHGSGGEDGFMTPLPPEYDNNPGGKYGKLTKICQLKDSIPLSASNVYDALKRASDMTCEVPADLFNVNCGDYFLLALYQLGMDKSDLCKVENEKCSLFSWEMGESNKCAYGEPSVVLKEIGNKMAYVNETLKIAVTATDSTNSSIHYTIENPLPKGATFDGQVFSWKPTVDQMGTYKLTFVASNCCWVDSETIIIVVSMTTPDRPGFEFLDPELDPELETWCHDFNIDLTVGMQGPEIEALQIALEKENINVLSYGELNANSFGNYTLYALQAFQRKYFGELLNPINVFKGTEYVGPLERNKLNSLYGCNEYLRGRSLLPEEPEWECMNIENWERLIAQSEVLLSDYLKEGQTLEQLAQCHRECDHFIEDSLGLVDYLVIGKVDTYYQCMDMDQDGDVDTVDQNLWQAKLMCGKGYNYCQYSCEDWRNLKEKIDKNDDNGQFLKKLFPNLSIPLACLDPEELSSQCLNNTSYDLNSFLDSSCNQCEFNKITPYLYGTARWYYGPPPIIAQGLSCLGIKAPDMLSCPKGFKVIHPALVLDIEADCSAIGASNELNFSITLQTGAGGKDGFLNPVSADYNDGAGEVAKICQLKDSLPFTASTVYDGLKRISETITTKKCDIFNVNCGDYFLLSLYQLGMDESNICKIQNDKCTMFSWEMGKSTKCSFGQPSVELGKIGDKITYNGKLLEFKVSAVNLDPDSSEVDSSIGYVLEDSLPEGATFDNQIFSWRPTVDQIGLHRLTFIASNCCWIDTETINVIVLGSYGNDPLQGLSLESESETWCHDFNSNLKHGVKGTEVYDLQIALTKEGFKMDSLEYVNKTDALFEDSTALAVVAFQEKYASTILAPYGLTKGTGFVGTHTRAKLNSLYGCEEYEDEDEEVDEEVDEIVDNTPVEITKSITIASPTSDAVWYYGKTYNILWGATGIDKVDISLISPNGTTLLASGIDASSGLYSLSASKFTPGDYYYVKIKDSSDSSVYTNSGKFKIVDNTAVEINKLITIASPTTDAVWYYGKTYNIIWGATGVDNIDIYLVRGSVSTLLGSNISASYGSYNLSPNKFTPGNDYYVKIVDHNDSSVYAESGYFSVINLGIGYLESQLATVSNRILKLIEEINEMINR